MMNWYESDTIAAVMHVPTPFFWRTAQLSLVLVLYRLLLEMSQATIVMLHISGARKIGDFRKGVREAASSQKRGPPSKKFGNLCFS